MHSPSYTQQVANSFIQSSPETFGDAHATTAELSSLRRLFREQGTREATLASIIESGYPLPAEVSPEMVALTGAAHACGIAIHLAEKRGKEGKDSTYDSYTTKNRFDRFVGIHVSEVLRDAWSDPIEREEGINNPNIVYPKGVNDSLVHGVAKPSRYLPAQTIRNLEFARLGKLDEVAQNDMLLTGVSPESLKIDWEELVPVIESATDTVQLAGEIGANIAKQLLANGLSVEQIAAVLRKGYSVRGIKEEHGNIPEAEATYTALVSALLANPTTAEVASLLK